MPKREQRKPDLKLVTGSPEFLQEDCSICTGSFRLPGKYMLVYPDESGVLLDLGQVQQAIDAYMVFHGRFEKTAVLYLQAGFKAVIDAKPLPGDYLKVHNGIIETRLVPRVLALAEVARESWAGQAQVLFDCNEIILGSLEKYQPSRDIDIVPRQLKIGGFVVFGQSDGRPHKTLKLPLMHIAVLRT